jgi:hypothetical protein
MLPLPDTISVDSGESALCLFGPTNWAERYAEKLATEKWENGEIGAILSAFEKFMVLNFSKVDKMAPISRFFIISRG